jgi:hypothetical protein
MSAHVNSSFSALDSDLNNGTHGYLARLDAASNVVGLTATLPAGEAAKGVTFANQSNQYVRVFLTPAAGATFPAGANTGLVPPQGVVSFSFDDDAVVGAIVQAVAAPAVGTVAEAGTLTASITGVVNVTINFIDA